MIARLPFPSSSMTAFGSCGFVYEINKTKSLSNSVTPLSSPIEATWPLMDVEMAWLGDSILLIPVGETQVTLKLSLYGT